MASQVKKSILRAKDRVRKYRDIHAAGVEIGEEKAAEFLLKKSNTFAPRHTGALIKSGRVVMEGTGHDAKASVTYGDEEVDYAVVVHEDLTKAHGRRFNRKYAREIAEGVDPSYFFKRRDREKAKFLQDSARDRGNIKKMRDIIRDEVTKMVRKL